MACYLIVCWQDNVWVLLEGAYLNCICSYKFMGSVL